jgi:ATP-dependent Clp protease ATP-binding subunit ClpA
MDSILTRMLDCDEKELIRRMTTLEDVLRSNLIAQDEVITSVSALLRQSFCRLWFDGQPLASALLLGPTGTGKTLLAELCNDHLFGSRAALIRLDMSEFQTNAGLERLIGDKDGGLFRHYYERAGGEGTLLFDEIEKAEPRVLDILLQILSAGRFTIGDGTTLDLSKFVVFATSNIGARVLMASRSTDRETIVERTETAVEADMRPEIVGRFDLICAFNKFSYDDLTLIAKLHMDKCLALINSRGHELSVGDGVLGFIQRAGYSEKFGARPIRNAAMRTLGGIVTDAIMASGGRPVNGVIEYNRRANQCFLA